MSAIATLERGTHQYTVDGVAVPLCVSDVLRLSGICQPYPEIPSVLNHVEHARELGETVHQWCDHLDLGGDRAVAEEALADSEPLPYVIAYTRFLEECRPSWEAIEKSFANVELGVAGTPDRVGAITHGGLCGTLAIIDIKTPSKPEKHWQLQLSAYQYLTGRNDYKLFALHLASDATYRLRSYKSDIETFLAAVKVAQWRLKNGVKL
jgi:hypothetical protein